MHFVNKVMREVTKALGIKQRLGSVYHPQSQGIVERANHVLKAKIAKICLDVTELVQALPIALMNMKMQTERIMHLTLHEMLTG